jgi:cell division protein FtsW
MKELVNSLKGDKVIWAFVALLALFSFMSVFSASSNLAYKNDGSGNTFAYLLKHAAQVLVGFFILYKIHKVPYHYFKTISKILLPVVWGLLIYTLLKGTIIEGANASRWIQIPFIGITFQTSALASIVLYVYVAHYLSKKRETPITFQNSLWELWTPVFITLIFILPANFSTAALIFSMVVMLVFIGKYPLKYIGVILGAGAIGLLFFVIVAITFPDAFPNRVDTWIARIDNFATDKPDEDDYQIEKAKIAIASGGLYGLGPGKSVQKNFLPQSSSDFIYAIIVEEYGMVGGIAVLGMYLLLLFRFVVAAHKANSLFGKLVVVGLGFPIIFQAMTNMAVAVELLPVTGQTLPLISSGGTSIWMTCIALGIILSVTKKEEEIAEELAEKQKREDALQKLIDKQLQEDEAADSRESEQAKQLEDFSIVDTANPMNAVLNKKYK